MTNIASPISENLSHNECWEIYEGMKAHDADYRMFEQGCIKAERVAMCNANFAHKFLESKEGASQSYYTDHYKTDVFTNINAAFDQMESEMEYQAQRDNDEIYWPYSSAEEEQEKSNMPYFQYHHLTTPVPAPDWKIASDKITALLSSATGAK